MSVLCYPWEPWFSVLPDFIPLSLTGSFTGGSRCRELCFPLCAGLEFPLPFPFTSGSLTGFPTPTEVWRLWFFWCCGCIFVSAPCFLALKLIIFMKRKTAGSLKAFRCFPFQVCYHILKWSQINNWAITNTTILIANQIACNGNSFPSFLGW